MICEPGDTGVAHDPDFGFGRGECCNKPVGCTMTHAGCKCLKHPWKRAMVLGDTDVRCQMRCLHPSKPVRMQCVLKHGHDGPCDLQPLSDWGLVRDPTNHKEEPDG